MPHLAWPDRDPNSDQVDGAEHDGDRVQNRGLEGHVEFLSSLPKGSRPGHIAEGPSTCSILAISARSFASPARYARLQSYIHDDGRDLANSTESLPKLVP